MQTRNKYSRAAALAAAALSMTVCACGSATGPMALTDSGDSADLVQTSGSTEAVTVDEEIGAAVSTEQSVDEAGITDSGNTEQDFASSGRHRRILPQETQEEAEEDAAGLADSSEQEITYPSSPEEVVPAGNVTGSSVMFIEQKKTQDSVLTKKKDSSYPDSEQDVDSVLSGLMDYWKDYDLKAVDYLVRMDKYRYLSGMLDGTEDYFYYGEENTSGEPDGTGVAVYAGNQYYYGNFVNGVREGTGFWYQIFMKDGKYSRANRGIYGHSYNGEWKNDLPDGKGQEHLDIDSTYLDGRIVTNVIGNFADGYYHGDEVVVTVDENEGQINWRGEAVYGTWKPYNVEDTSSASGDQIAVLQNTDNDGNYFWMERKENHGQGITGLLPSGN